MIAVIPLQGGVDIYYPGSLPTPRSDAGRVKVSLNHDDQFVGSVTFPVSGEENPRATEATYLLCGSYLKVNGEAIFEVPDDTLMQEVLEAL